MMAAKSVSFQQPNVQQEDVAMEQVEKESIPVRAIVGYVVNCSHESKSAIALKMGRNRWFLNNYTTKGKIPSVPLLFEIIAACGYDVHIIGHGKDITVEVENAD